MSTLDLSAFPIIAFSACIRHGELHVVAAEGNMLALFDTASTHLSWLDNVIHPDDRAAFLSPSSGESRQLIRLHASDAKWHWFHLRICEVRQDGDARCYSALLTDATEFKAMQDIAQRYRDYTEITTDWYWEMDEEHRFSYFSREFEEITGVPSAGTLGKTRWGGIGKENLGNTDWEAHKALMDAHTPIRNFEYPGRRADGRILWFRVSGSPRYNDSGQFIGYYGIAADISATRHTEERLQQSARLASIGQLAAGVAHEINNPIGFVRSNVEMLGKYLDTLLQLLGHYSDIESSCVNAASFPALQEGKKKADLAFLREDAPALLAECRNGLDRVRKIVADLRDFSCEGDTGWSEIDIHHCLESALNLITGGLPKTIEINLQYTALPPLRCKPLQLNQVFLALLNNAAQALGDQPGCITVSTGQNKTGEIWVEIADTGSGIAAEHLPRIFEPFFTTRPIGKGTGMGLAMSFGIVADHAGRIDVQSTPGCGSAFRVILPDNPEQKA